MSDPHDKERWYCLNRDGMATLCVDEEDAQEVAAESWVLYPQNGPYRAARMVDAGEIERLRAALAIVREYPDFDAGGALPKMIDQVLSGKPAPMLDAPDRLGLGAQCSP